MSALAPSNDGGGRRLITRVLWAKSRPEHGVVSPGEVLKVGRTDRADLVLPKDRQLGGVHFLLQWDGARCRLIDRGSPEGTLVHGEQVTEAEINHGDWIRAGQSDFLVYFEAHSPKPLREPDRFDTEDREERATEALAALRAQPEPLYGVFDAARDERILVLLRESVERFQNLYEGIAGEALEDMAPHLVAFRPDSGLLDRLVSEGWGRRWGIFLTTRARFRDVRRHLRRFLMVMLEEQRDKVYFRYYDPWVLRVFLPSCSRRQLSTLFGSSGDDADAWRFAPMPDEITAFLVEGDDLRLARLTPSEPGG